MTPAQPRGSIDHPNEKGATAQEQPNNQFDVCAGCERLCNQFLLARATIDDILRELEGSSVIVRAHHEQMLGLLGDLRDMLARAFSDHRDAQHSGNEPA